MEPRLNLKARDPHSAAETLRLMPHGVRTHLANHTPPHTWPAPILEWAQAKNLIKTSTSNNNKGMPVLTHLGNTCQKQITKRMKGRL